MSCLSLIKILVLKIARVIFPHGRHASVSAQIMPVILSVSFGRHKTIACLGSLHIRTAPGFGADPISVFPLPENLLVPLRQKSYIL